MKLIVLLWATVCLACAQAAPPKPPIRERSENVFTDTGNRISTFKGKKDKQPNWDNVNITGKEFNYEYDGQITVGMPGTSKQHSIQRLNAKVTISFPVDFDQKRIAYMRFKTPNIYKGQNLIKRPKCIQPRQTLEQVSILPELKEAMETPLKFHYENGMIKDVIHSKQDFQWVTNMKRGVLNMLQVNLKKENELPDDDPEVNKQKLPFESPVMERQNQSSDFFRVMEKTLEGNCEIAYTVVEKNQGLPQQSGETVRLLKVRKTINFENCQQRPEIRYNYRFGATCQSQDSKYQDNEKIMKSSTIIRSDVLKTSNRILVQNSQVESQYAFAPMIQEENIAVAHIKQKLRLINTQPIQDVQKLELLEPETSSTGLQFDHTFDADVEKLDMLGSDAKLSRPIRNGKHPFSKIDLVATAKQLLERLSNKIGDNDDQIEAGAERLFQRAVVVLRKLGEQELKDVIDAFLLSHGGPGPVEPSSQEIVNTQQNKQQQPWGPGPVQRPWKIKARHWIIKHLLPQLLANAGTRVSIKVLLDRYEKGDFPTARVTLALISLVDTPIVSKEIIQDLITFSENSNKPKNNEHLRHTLLLVIGSLMNGLCVPNEDVFAQYQDDKEEDFCPKELREKYAQMLFTKGEQTKEWYNDLVLMKVVGNAALETMTERLEKIINQKEKQYPMFLRREAVLSLRKIAEVQPHRVQRILVPLIMDKREHQAVRMAAADVLLRDVNPEIHILHQMVSLTNEPDESTQVKSLINSILHQLANTSNPCHSNISTDATRALRHSKPKIPKAKFLSTMKQYSAHDEDRDVGLDLDIMHMYHNESHAPHSVSVDLHQNLFGFFKKSLIKLELVDHGLIEHVVDEWANKGQLASGETEAEMTPGFKSRREQIKNKVDEILNSLFNRSHYNNPRPVALGRIGLKMIQRNKGYLPIGAKLEVDLHSASKLDGGNNDIKFTINAPQEKRDFVMIETRPMTYVREWPVEAGALLPDIDEKTIVGEECDRVIQYKKCIGRDLLGMQFCVRNRLQYCRGENLNMLDLPFKGHSKLSLYVEPDIDDRTTQSINIADKNIIIKLNTQLNRPADEHTNPELIRTASDERSSSSSSSSGSKSQEQHHNQRQGALNRNSQQTRLLQNRRQSGKMYKLLKPTKHVVDLSIEHNQHKVNALVKIIFDQQQFGKIDAKISAKGSHMKEAHDICLLAEALLPSKPYKVEEVQEKVLKAKAKINFGPTCNSLSEQSPGLNIKFEGYQSKEQIHKYKKDGKYRKFVNCHDQTKCSPIMQYKYLTEISDLRHYKLTVEHKHLPNSVKNISKKLVDLLKANHWLQTSTDATVNNRENKIKATIKLDQAMESFNLTYKAPYENTKINDIEAYLPVYNVKKPYHGIGPVSPYDSCRIGLKKIVQYDGEKISVIFDPCYKLLTADCSNSRSLAILTRTITQPGTQKEVKIAIAEHEINLVPGQQSKVSVFVDGQALSLQTPYQKIQFENNTIEITKEGSYISVRILPDDVIVYYDIYAINIKVNRLNMNDLCGLCGLYNTEPTQPSNQISIQGGFGQTQNVRDLVNSFTVQTPNQPCNFPTTGGLNSRTIRQAGDEGGFLMPRRIRPSKPGNQRSTTEPVLKTKKLENDNDLLLSTVGLYQCPNGFHPVQLGELKSVKYAAISRDDERSHGLEKRVDQNQELKPEQLTGFPVVLERQERLHLKCKRDKID